MSNNQPLILCLSGLDSVYVLLRLRAAGQTPDVVLMAMDGNEDTPLVKFMESRVFPFLRDRRIRTVQVARASALRSDGIVVLDDSTSPTKYYCDVPYSVEQSLLSQAMLYPGPGYLSNFLGWTLQRWILDNYAGYYPRVYIGIRDNETPGAMQYLVNPNYWRLELPLVDWQVSRNVVEQSIQDWFGVVPQRRRIIPTGREPLDDLLELYAQQPHLAIRPLLSECVAMAIHPRLRYGWRTLLKMPLRDTLLAVNNWPAELLFQEYLDSLEWTVYKIRRVFDPARRELIPFVATTNRDIANRRINRMADEWVFPGGMRVTSQDVWRLWFEKTSQRESFAVPLPAVVDKHVPPDFEVHWLKAQNNNDDD